MKKHVDYYAYISKRILFAKFKIDRGRLYVVCVYAPEEGKDEDTNNF